MPVAAGAVGYVQHVDVGAIDASAGQVPCEVYLAVLPGAFVHADTPIAWVVGQGADADADAVAVRDAFTIADERSFDQDPRFGLVVLGEIASRALSPGVNDPGTAIDVIGRCTRLLSAWAEGTGAAGAEITYPHVHVPPLASKDLFEDAFMLVARDGAGKIEIQLRLQKALAALARCGGDDVRDAARHQWRLARERADAALTLEADRARLREDGARVMHAR